MDIRQTIANSIRSELREMLRKEIVRVPVHGHMALQWNTIPFRHTRSFHQQTGCDNLPVPLYINYRRFIKIANRTLKVLDATSSYFKVTHG